MNTAACVCCVCLKCSVYGAMSLCVFTIVVIIVSDEGPASISVYHVTPRTGFLLCRHHCCLFSRQRYRIPIPPQRYLHPRLCHHTWHAPQLLLPQPRLPHARQPHAKVLQRPPGEEGGGDPNPTQVTLLRPAAAEGSQSAPARPEECQVQDRVHQQPEAPA